MPIYSFTCRTCGDFTEMRSMACADAPARCPLCGGAAMRVFTVPHIARMNPALRRAHELNEKSAHEPRIVSAEDWQRERALGVGLGAAGLSRRCGAHVHRRRGAQR
jgi:putative FmdB family regulatory protein